MGAHNVFNQMGLTLSLGENSPIRIPDPGNAGTLDLNPNLAFQICVLEGTDAAASETRVIPEPTNFGLGSVLLLIGDNPATGVTTTDITLATSGNNDFKADGSDAILMDADGENCALIVISAGGTKYWRQLYTDGATIS